MNPHPFPADPSSNATTHGLTAKRPLDAEERERMEVIVASWTSKSMPETPPEEALIASAAIEYVRYLRCVEAEESRLKPGRQQALSDWRERKQHAVRRRAQDLKREPEAVIADLHETAFGIDWMLRHWRHLRARLDSPRPWTAQDLLSAMNLLGHEPSPPLDRTSPAGLVWCLTAASFPKLFQPATETPGNPSALDQLRSLLDDQIARLETLRPIVWDDIDAPEAVAVETASMVDTSKDGQLRQRYRREAFRDFHKSLHALDRLRAERSKAHAREAKLMDASASRRSEAPAYVPPPPESRNGPPPGPDSSPEDRRNPQAANAIRNTPAEPSTTPAERTNQRTGERTETHPGLPGTSSGSIGRPARPINHPDDLPGDR
ncbi:hypothetical protein AB1L88_20615 [Tautonia sp. JC769]|uniref:hypothetical protein n=1 Tax=Tautonia sp. JC769 TaxID=3232135 RepID=UPI00345AB7C3